MRFDWDAAKAAANLRKHKVLFVEAASVFGDPLACTFADPDHSTGESRWLTFGISHAGRLLVVSHADYDDHIRIISARRATRREQVAYEQGDE